MLPKSISSTKSLAWPRIALIAVVLVIVSYVVVLSVNAQIQQLRNDVRLGVIGVPMRINPLWSSGNPIDSMIVPMVFRSVVLFNEKSEPIGDLADRWEISEDGKSYVVYLKSGQKWHDGEDITADDVVFTYQRTQDHEYTGPEKDRFKGVTIEKREDLVVVFNLTEQFTPFIESLNLAVLPEHIWNNTTAEEMRTATYNLKPIGAGKYSVTDIYTENQTIQNLTLKAVNNEEPVKQLQLKFYEDKTMMNLAYKLGEVDGFLTYDPLIARTYLKWDNTNYQRITYCGQLLSIFINLQKDSSHPVMQNNFKVALYSATNLTKLDSYATFNPIPQGHWAYKQTPQPAIIPEEQLPTVFSQVPGIDQTIQIVTTQHEVAQQFARTLTAFLKQYGVKLNLTVASNDKLQETTLPDRSFDLLLVQQKLGHDPDQYTFWHSSQTDLKVEGLNASNYASRRADRALEQGRTLRSQEERTTQYHTFQEELTQDKPALFVSHPPIYLVMREKAPLNTLETCIWEQADLLTTLTTADQL